MVADCDPHEGNQTCSYVEAPFYIGDRSFLKKFFLESLDQQDYEVARVEVNSFLIKCFSA